jgi:hypothetical protein
MYFEKPLYFGGAVSLCADVFFKDIGGEGQY